MRAGELAEVFRAGAEAVSGIAMLREEGLPSELYGPAAVRRSLEAMEAKATEIEDRGKAPVPDPAMTVSRTRRMAPVTYQDPVIAWLPEAGFPQGQIASSPPPVPFTVTRSEVIIRQDQAPVVHIWFTLVPAVPG